MEHYICTGGCKGVAPTPGVCGAEECPKHDHPLLPCTCEDGRHYGAFDLDHSRGPDHAHAVPMEEPERDPPA